MTVAKVFISDITDGSMLDRSNQEDKKIINNRRKFLETRGIDINKTTRVRVEYSGDNFKRYRELSRKDLGQGMQDNNVPISDALVTRELDHALFLPIADCVGVVLFCQAQSVLMLSHLGRHSILQEGGEESVLYLVRQFGCVAKDIKIWLSPAPDKKNYPLYDRDNRSMKDVLKEQFTKAGISENNITDYDIDPTEDKRYFSHSEFLKGNRDEDGRFAMVAVMRPDTTN
jgi:copper oxidase (laccase) domain-containing protein